MFKYIGWVKPNGKIDGGEILFDLAVISILGLITWVLLITKGII